MNVAALVALAEKNPQGVITLAHAIVDPLSDKPELLTDAIGAATGGKLAVLGFAASTRNTPRASWRPRSICFAATTRRSRRCFTRCGPDRRAGRTFVSSVR
jgi:hypothetical protein